MAQLPNELTREVSKYVAKEDLPSFRFASRTRCALSRDFFVSKCFENIVTSINVVTLDGLLSAVRHAEYGPAIKTITFQMNGVDDKISVVRHRFLGVMRALFLRRQQVVVKFLVNAMALPQSVWHDYNIAAIFEHMMGHAYRLNVLSGPIEISLPSPVGNYSISPARRHLAGSIGRISARRTTRITYTDMPGSITYDPATQTLSITMLNVKHIHELLPGILNHTAVRRLSITTSEIDQDTLGEVFWLHKGHLAEVELRDISLFSRGHRGVLSTASWLQLLEMMAYLNHLARLDMADLTGGEEPGLAGGVQVATVSAVGRPAILHNLYTEFIRLNALRR